MSSLDKFLTFAHSAGMQRSQLERFLAAGYVPTARQILAHVEARRMDRQGYANELLFGGARGGGKTHGLLAQAGIDDCQRFDGLKFLFLRKIGASAKESLDDLRMRLFAKIPHEFSRGNIYFLNGSRIISGHFYAEKDVDKYIGLEFDGLILEEAGTLSKAKIEAVGGSIRSSRQDWRVRKYYSTNPGGVGHAYLKKKFILPFRQNKETETRFIPSSSKDNPYLSQDYKTYLNSLTGWLREAWLEGNWDVAAGQYFDNFNYDKVVCKPNKISADLKPFTVWASLDYGFNHYTTCYLFCKIDGIVYIVDEFAARRQLVKTNCEGIIAMLNRNGLELSDLATFVSGPDVFAKRGDTGTCVADEFAKYGIYLRPAKTDRIAGATKMLQMFGDEKQGIEPTIRISNRCTGLIECLPNLMHDENRPEDVRKVDIDDEGIGGDDYYDGTRYGVMESDISKGVIF